MPDGFRFETQKDEGNHLFIRPFSLVDVVVIVVTWLVPSPLHFFFRRTQYVGLDLLSSFRLLLFVARGR